MGKKFSPYVIYDNGGYGYIKSNLQKFNLASSNFVYFILTDLDKHDCAPSLRTQWIPPYTYHENMIFRIAVREVEAWLLADRLNFAKFLGISNNLIPEFPETLTDPKTTLIQLASKCKTRSIKEAIVPDPKTRAKQGPDYNGSLSHFVFQSWNIDIAKKNSLSLQRAITHLNKFQNVCS